MKFRGNLQKRAVSVVLAIALVTGCTFNTAAAESGAPEREPQEVTKSYDSGNVTMTNTLQGDSDAYTVNLKIRIKNIGKFPSAKSLAAAGVDTAAAEKDEGSTEPAGNGEPRDSASSAPAAASQPETISEAPVVSESSSDAEDTAPLTAAAKTAAVKTSADETTADSEESDVTSSAAPDASVVSGPEGKSGDTSVSPPAPEEPTVNEEPEKQADEAGEIEPEEPESYEVRYYIPAGFALKTVPDNAAEEDGYVSFAGLTAEDLQSFSAGLQLEPAQEDFSQGTDTQGMSGLYVGGILLYAFAETSAVEAPGVERTVSLDNWDDRTYNVDLSITAKSEMSTQTKPCDIILVLDRSGSMDEGYNVYTPVTGSLNSDSTYYVKTGSGYESVSYHTTSEKISYGFFESVHYPRNGWYTDWDGGLFADKPDFDSMWRDPSQNQFYTKSSQKKLDALKAAADNFVDSVAAKSPDSKIAVVSFSDSAATTIGLTSLTDANVTTIEGKINALTASGATHSDAGLEMARNIYGGDSGYDPDDRDRVVIMFTDGVPTDHDSFEDDVAASAINQAAVLKKTYNISANSDVSFHGRKGTAVSGKGCGATVYTIGLFSGLNSGTQARVDDYMTQVASDQNKYLKPSETLSLDDIFGQISHEVGGISGATVTDVIDPRFDIVNDGDDALGSGDEIVDSVNNATGTIGRTTSGGKTCWTITWDTGEIPVNDNGGPGWQTSYRVRAKPQFVGGNNIPVNTDDAKVVYTTDGDSVPFDVQPVNVKPRFFVKDAETTLFYGEVPGTGGIPALSASFSYPYTTDCYGVVDEIPQGTEIAGDDGDDENGMYLGMGSTGDFNTEWTASENAPLVSGEPSIAAFDPHGASDGNLNYTAHVTFDPDYDSADGNQRAADTNTDDEHAENLSKDGAYAIHILTGTLTITKALDTTSSADPDPYFTFKIERFSSDDDTGMPLSTSYQVVYTNNKSGGAEIRGLPYGYYKVTEIPNSGWRYKQEGAVEYNSDYKNNQQYLGRTSAFDAGTATFNQSVSAAVTNTLSNPYWIGGKDSVQNNIRVSTN